MSLVDKIKEAFVEDDDEQGKHSAPIHNDDDGHLKTWSALDLSEDELVDDEWIRNNTKEVQ